MQRSAGVTVIAVLQFLGSLLTLAMAGLMIFAFAFAQKQAMPSTPGAPPMAIMMALAAAMYFLPAVWGFITCAGVWRLKNWARISTIVSAVILCCFGAFTCLGALAMPVLLSSMPTQAPNPQQFKMLMTVSMLIFGLGEVGVGLWWAIYFTRRSVVAQFAAAPAIVPAAYDPMLPTVAAATPRRPISISIIAWFLLVSGGLFLPVTLFARSPQVLMGRLITGPAVFAVTTAYLLALVYVGIGLLKLWPSARLAGIAYFAFGILNAVVSWLRPGSSELFHRMMAEQPKFFGPTPEMNLPDTFFKVVMVGSAIVMVIPIYFLATRKKAFEAGGSGTGN